MENKKIKENKIMISNDKEVCYTCNGTGRVEDFTGTGMMDCPRCQGTGYIIKYAEDSYRDWLD